MHAKDQIGIYLIFVHHHVVWRHMKDNEYEQGSSGRLLCQTNSVLLPFLMVKSHLTMTNISVRTQIFLNNLIFFYICCWYVLVPVWPCHPFLKELTWAGSIKAFRLYRVGCMQEVKLLKLMARELENTNKKCSSWNLVEDKVLRFFLMLTTSTKEQGE